ncbi:efflux RND transporter periplasmic adaptor subunit [Variovorax sp. Sphag1AA]|uniref:efflux RND transporter periplasmic adaptor subunit n=1 Tax=Variovorax sp. Sphag1AA TaxID=2587027 RepID=UPI00160C48BC|nr:efflux RND transporter periplasmic adaptor subunit [Variovorax sp. Sphag1AA]MBB3176815.1 HlyD family secretion protein [Variovorax sp. Sphag1AA]
MKLDPSSTDVHPGDLATRAVAPVGPTTPRVPEVGFRQKLQRRAPAALAVLALIALGIVFGPRLLWGPRVAVTPVVRGDFIQSVVASGHVEAPHRVSIGAQLAGEVKTVPVEEGQEVAAGQVLIQLADVEWVAAAAQADAAVQQAEARLRLVREVQEPVAEQALRQAEIGAENARAQWRRNAALHEQGFVGQAALDDLRKAVDLSDALVRAARKQLASTQPGGSDHAVATTALAEANAAAAAAHTRLKYTTIKAPVGGTLIDRSVEPGDVVQPGKTLMVLSPAGETQLVVQIDEKNLALLSMGQQAVASADAYADQRFGAELVYINPGVDVQRGSVEVKFAVPHPPASLRQDMTVSVQIRTAFRSQAVLLSSDAVRDADRGQPWVLKVDGHRVRRQAVKLGLHSGGLSEVLEGLQPGDLVVPASTPDIAEGSRLQPRVRVESAA